MFVGGNLNKFEFETFKLILMQSAAEFVVSRAKSDATLSVTVNQISAIAESMDWKRG